MNASHIQNIGQTCARTMFLHVLSSTIRSWSSQPEDPHFKSKARDAVDMEIIMTKNQCRAFVAMCNGMGVQVKYAWSPYDSGKHPERWVYKCALTEMSSAMKGLRTLLFWLVIGAAIAGARTYGLI